MKPLANRVPCFYQKLFMIKQAKKLNERLRISATKNKILSYMFITVKLAAQRNGYLRQELTRVKCTKATCQPLKSCHLKI